MRMRLPSRALRLLSFLLVAALLTACSVQIRVSDGGGSAAEEPAEAPPAAAISGKKSISPAPRADAAPDDGVKADEENAEEPESVPPQEDDAEPSWESAESWREEGPVSLTAAELQALTDALDINENGFFVCTYDRPEEIDWREVFYQGAGVGRELTEEERAAYEREYGEIVTDIEAIPAENVRSFVSEKTGTRYEDARRPLRAGFWDYMDAYDLYLFQHGDTNLQPVAFTDGTRDGDLYRLSYTRTDWQETGDERPFVITAFIRDGAWQYVSNVPADVPEPLPLVTIEYYETREEAQAAHRVTAFAEPALLPSDEPSGICWAVVTAETDGVRYSVDRTIWDGFTEEILSMVYATNYPDVPILAGVLDAGESAAILVNRPWYPHVRVTAAQGGYWGEFWIGEDNWLHLDDGAPRWITGHDLEGEGRGCTPKDERALARFLSGGGWFCLDGETGEVLSGVVFDDEGMMRIVSEAAEVGLTLRYDRLEAGEDEAPDLLVLGRGDDPYADWSALPDWYDFDAFGDYLVSAAQSGDRQILTLSQANNGEGALAYLLGTDPSARTFTLVRYRGTEAAGPRG